MKKKKDTNINIYYNKLCVVCCLFTEAILKAVSQMPTGNLPLQSLTSVPNKQTQFGKPELQSHTMSSASGGHGYPGANRLPPNTGMRMPQHLGSMPHAAARSAPRHPVPASDTSHTVDEQKERQKQEVLQVIRIF